MTKRPRDDTHSHSEDPYRERSFGRAPVVGQKAKPYTSGSQGHGVHQNRTRAPEPGAKGTARSDGPFRRGSGN